MTQKHPVLMAIPHAGTYVPEDIRARMQISDHKIREHSDLYTDQIFGVDEAHCVTSDISRLVVDLNRAPDHLEMRPQHRKNGVVVNVTEDGNPLYEEFVTIEEAQERVEKYHMPFHHEVNALLPEMRFFIDSHSMKSVGPATKEDAGAPRPDINLGNWFYMTCSREMTHAIAEFFEDKGLETKINEPYYGMYNLGYHCCRQTMPGVLLEFNRKLYMNEETLEPYPDKIAQYRECMAELCEKIHHEFLTL